MKTTALTMGTNPMVIVPTDFQSAMAIAEVMVKAGFGNLKNKEQAFVAMQLGAGVGLTPMQAMLGVSVINGKPALYGDTMLAVVKASGLLEYIKEEIVGKDDMMVAKCTVKRKGEPEPVCHEWSVADAKKAGKWGTAGVWTQYGKRMLQMRPRGFSLRDAFPDLLLGLQHTVEELTDGPIINVTQESDNKWTEGTDLMMKRVVQDTVLEQATSSKVSLYGSGSVQAMEVEKSDLYELIEKMIGIILDTGAFEEYTAWSRTNYPIIQGVIPKGSPESLKLGKLYIEKKKQYGTVAGEGHE